MCSVLKYRYVVCVYLVGDMMCICYMLYSVFVQHVL